MRLTKIQEYMKSHNMPYDYAEENDCGSINFIHRGLSYHIWEYWSRSGEWTAMFSPAAEVWTMTEIMSRPSSIFLRRPGEFVAELAEAAMGCLFFYTLPCPFLPICVRYVNKCIYWANFPLTSGGSCV